MSDLEALAQIAAYFAGRERKLRSQAACAAAYGTLRKVHVQRRDKFRRWREAVEWAIETMANDCQAYAAGVVTGHGMAERQLRGQDAAVGKSPIQAAIEATEESGR